MSWRIHQNEEHFSDATKLAWEFVLPHRHLPILERDRERVKKVRAFLERSFSKQAMRSAVKRLGI